MKYIAAMLLALTLSAVPATASSPAKAQCYTEEQLQPAINELLKQAFKKGFDAGRAYERATI